jgi:hypothetical protein
MDTSAHISRRAGTCTWRTPKIDLALLTEVCTAAARWAPRSQRSDALQCAPLRILELLEKDPLAGREELNHTAANEVQANRPSGAKVQGHTPGGFGPRMPAGLPDIPARIVLAVVNSFFEQGCTSVPEHEMYDRVRLFTHITRLDDQFQGLDQ